MTPGNLFQNVPDHLATELFETLLETPGLRVERIISTGHTTPAGQWYDQPQDEWILLLDGSATLHFDPGNSVDLQPGDYLHIPAHQRHRVARTDPFRPTVWLALHFPATETCDHDSAAHRSL